MSSTHEKKSGADKIGYVFFFCGWSYRVISIWKTFGSCLSSLLLLYECMYYAYSCAHLYVMRAVSFFLSLCIQTPYKKKQRSKKVGNAD